jgi:formylglycine-generating enzyme required for sulfatase activity
VKSESTLQAVVQDIERPVGPIWTNVMGMMYAWIPPGTFLMGSPANEPERRDDETQHKVTLTKGFHLGVHQVTQAQWQAVMGGNPSYHEGRGQSAH